jgi:hypothetical protein
VNLKYGVHLKDLQPQTVLAMLIVNGIYEKRGLECVITSVNDGKHIDASWHYKGRAFDVRTKQAALDGKERELCDEIQAALGPDFDVVLEAVGTPNEHIHVEFDPE